MVKASSILTFLTVGLFAMAIVLYAMLSPEKAEATYSPEDASNTSIDYELDTDPLDEYQLHASGVYGVYIDEYIDEYGDEITIKGNIVYDSFGNYLGELDGDILDEDM